MKSLVVFVLLVAGGMWWAWDAFNTDRIQAFVDSKIYEKWGPQAEYNLAQLCELTGRYEGAIHCYSAIMEAVPHSELAEKAMYRTAICLSQLNKFTESVATFDAFLEKYPESLFRDLAQRRRAGIFNR